jgi:hypothetical protein
LQFYLVKYRVLCVIAILIHLWLAALPYIKLVLLVVVASRMGGVDKAINRVIDIIGLWLYARVWAWLW